MFFYFFWKIVFSISLSYFKLLTRISGPIMKAVV